MDAGATSTRPTGEARSNSSAPSELVTNILTLWNSGYMNHGVEHLRAQGIMIADEDLEHLSP
jgi:TnpA family transposase